MDPFSIFASSLAVVGAVAKVSSGIRQLINLRKAPEEVIGLLSDLERLKGILEATKDVDRDRKIEPQLQRLGEILLELENLIEHRLKSSQNPKREEFKVSKTRYLLEKEKIKAVRLDIGHILVEINLVLNTRNAAELQLAIQTINRMESLIREIPEAKNNSEKYETGKVTEELELEQNQYRDKLLTKPSLLSNSLDLTSTLEESAESLSNESSGKYNLSQVKCTCRRLWSCRRRSSAIPFKGLTVRGEKSWLHHEDCPCFIPSQVSTSVDVKFAWLSKFISQISEFSLSLRYGSGGYAVVPGFTLRGSMRKESPAFIQTLFRKHNLIGATDYDWKIEYEDRLDDAWEELLRIFQEGKAHPSEVNSEGRNLFWQLEDYFYGNTGPFRDSISGRPMEAKSKFMNNLRSVGVPVNETSATKHHWKAKGPTSTLEVLLWEASVRERESPILNTLKSFIEADAEVFGRLDGYFWKWDVWKRLIQRGEEFAEALKLNSLSQAVINENVSVVRKLVKSQCDSIDSRDALNLNALEWSTNSPQILPILLDNHPNLQSADMDKILYFACEARCLETVELLLERKAPVSLQTLASACRSSNLRLFQLIATGLARQRENLYELASKYLPPDTLFGLHSPDLGLMDKNTVEVVERLSEKGISLGPHKIELDGIALSVYEEILEDGVNWNSWHEFEAGRLFRRSIEDLPGYEDLPSVDDFMGILYSTGFKNLNVITETRTFLCPKPLQWMITRGLDLNKVIPFEHDNTNSQWMSEYQTTVAFYASYCCGVHIQQLFRLEDYVINGWTPVGKILRQSMPRSVRELVSALTSAILDCEEDSCSCPCNPEGCTVIAQMLKYVLFYNDWSSSSFNVARALLETFLEMVTASGVESRQIARIYIRMLLFEWLELKHACCQPRPECWRYCLHPPLNAEDADEIREEQHERIQIFEELVQKANQEFQFASGSLVEFLIGFRNDNILPLIEQDVTEQDKRKIRELGVELE